ncbi:MAG TPA: glycerophosphodiester phosphodiesterase family protein [Candidatus Eisenbacteria bacterium]|nr:glycerophosphodiester phosphodiesterase family protein [Candidatus Eisenbacteria bacterium]
MYLRIAHRGAPHLAPENSLKSFEASLAFSPDMVEMDVRVSRDGHVVVMHDQTVDRMTTGRGKVILKTLAQLRACRFGNGEHIPTMAEAVDLLKGKAELKVDVKDVGIEDLVVGELRRAGVVRCTIVIAYGRKALAAFKDLCPSLRTEVGGVFSGRNRDPAIADALQTGATVLSTRYKIVTPDFVKECRANGLAIHAWTVNDRKAAARMTDLGVDAVATDRLDIV